MSKIDTENPWAHIPDDYVEFVVSNPEFRASISTIKQKLLLQRSSEVKDPERSYHLMSDLTHLNLTRGQQPPPNYEEIAKTRFMEDLQMWKKGLTLGCREIRPSVEQ